MTYSGFLIAHQGIIFAKSGQKHIQLWDDVFGISDNSSRNNILPLWKTAQEVIDDIGNDYRDLRENFSWFTWGNYGHRLLFHWASTLTLKDIHRWLSKSAHA